MMKMSIKYDLAEDVKGRVIDIVNKLGFGYIDTNRIMCIRSSGSQSFGTIARCHALSKIWQKTLQCKSAYIIEILSERFDRMSEDEQTKTLIHELMHIPKAFGGGFKHHDFVTSRNIDMLYRKLKDINFRRDFL